MTERGTQVGATCGLFAVDHVSAAAANARHEPHRPTTRVDFERRGREARVGVHAAQLMQPGGANYDFAVLHTNAQASGVSLFPMSPADLEGTAERASVVAGGRFENLLGDHMVREGAFRAAGYILRIPEHNGHWIALVPPTDAGDRNAGRALLCDSLYPRPFLLENGDAQLLLTAAAFDGAAARQFNPNAFNAQWGCFLAALS